MADIDGRSFVAGPLQAGPQNSHRLVVPVRPLPAGTYSVKWRTVSRIDGDLVTGSFRFAGRAAATHGGSATPAAVALPRAPLGVVGRALFYAGLMALLGAAFARLVVFRERIPALTALLSGGWVVATCGLMCLMQSRRAAAGIDVGQFLGSSHGRTMLWRGVPLTLAGLGAIAEVGGRWDRRGPVLAGVGALGVVLGHVGAGHAASGPNNAMMITAQWVHVVAVSVWIGGLAALLAGLSGRSPRGRAEAVRRFSTAAGVALAVVVVTGLVRAVDENGGWRQLPGTPWGRLAVVKVGLLTALAALGAINRYRNVRHAERSARGLRRVGGAEVTIAAVVIAVTGLLTETAPPGAARPPEPRQVSASGSDAAKTIDAHLVVSPGRPGINTFTVRLRRYHSGEPVDAARVNVRFSPLHAGGRPHHQSTLEMTTREPGVYASQGTNLAGPGRWRLVLVVIGTVGTVEVPMELDALGAGRGAR